MIGALPPSVRVLAVNSELDLQVRPVDYLPLHQMLQQRARAESWADLPLHHILIPANLSSSSVSSELIDRLAGWLNNDTQLESTQLGANTSHAFSRRSEATNNEDVEEIESVVTGGVAGVAGSCTSGGSTAAASVATIDTGLDAVVPTSVVTSRAHQSANNTNSTSASAHVTVQGMHPIFQFLAKFLAW